MYMYILQICLLWRSSQTIPQMPLIAKLLFLCGQMGWGGVGLEYYNFC